MAFHVYPDPQTAPLTLLAGTTSGPATIDLAFGAAFPPPPPGNYNRTIRVVMLPVGGPAPTISLAADTGDPVPLPFDLMYHSLFNLPAGAGVDVADARISPEAQNVFRIDVSIYANAAYVLTIRNNDVVVRGFTWVSATTTGESHQPWIDAAPALSYDVLTNQVVPFAVAVANKGTGPLTIADAVGTALGSGFQITGVPAPINANAGGQVQITFTGPGAPGQSNATYSAGSNDTTAMAGGGHNRQVALSAKTGALEIALTLDGSGSMAVRPDGTPAVSPTDARWSFLETASRQLLDILGHFAAGGGFFAIDVFPDVVAMTPCPCSADIQTRVPIAAPAIAAAKTRLGDPMAPPPAPLLPFNSTPMSDGIGRAIGTLPNAFGYFDGTQPALVNNRRFQILMSDGAHNCGPDPNASGFYAGALSYADKHVKAITVGYGNMAAVQYQVNWGLLQAIATNSGGEFLSSGANNAGLDLPKAFRTALQSGLTMPQVALDPFGVLTTAAPVAYHTVDVLPFDDRVAFVVNWTDPFSVRVEVRTPAGELITTDTKERGVSVSRDPRYTIIGIAPEYLRNDPDPARPRFGPWTLIVTLENFTGLLAGPASVQQGYEYDVLVGSRLQLTASADRPVYYAGEHVDVSASVTLDGLPIADAVVKIEQAAPGQSLDNFIAGNGVSAQMLARAREHLGHGDVNAIGVRAFALHEMGLAFDDFNVPTTIVAARGADGAYHATFDNTSTPGNYSYHATATGHTDDGIPFRRERRFARRLDPLADPAFTLVDIAYASADPLIAATVTITPRDRFGNVILIDPAFDSRIQVHATDARLAGELQTDADGRYTQRIEYSPAATPVIDVTIDGVSVVTRHALPHVSKLLYVDEVVDFAAGTEAVKGANLHADPKSALGDVVAKGPDQFVALGAGGRIELRLRGREIVGRRHHHRGARDFDVYVFVEASDALRPYRVEAFGRREGEDEDEWVALGDSPGTSMGFRLRTAGLHEADAIRITDRSRRVRAADQSASAAPGIAIRGVGIRATEPGDR